jgi:hypothetical protein
MKTRLTSLFTVLALPVFSIFNLEFSTAQAQGTAFTYQGRLNNGANPANGSYDLKFSLFNVSNGGSAAAGPETNSLVVVNNGLFTTMLDFGPTVFNGTTYWLEIGVRTNGVGGFVTLNPRQQLTPVPNAIFAENATALANGVAIGSGQNNMVQPGAAFAFIGGGLNNEVTSKWSVIGGGNGNVINLEPTGAPTMASTIGGGLMNSTMASYATVSGGFGNTASGMYSTVGGGSNNIASGFAATVAGGDPNHATGPYSFIGGGDNNTASSAYSSIVGGSFNLADGNNSTIGGGGQNTASDTTATVGGGSDNIASGISSTVPGGFDNVASGSVSFAAGSGAQAVNDNSFVWSDGGSFGFSSTLPKQFKIAAANGVEMDVAGSSGVNPAALYVNSISTNGVGLYVVQTNSSDACVVLNSFSAASSYVGGGDLIKGFGWTKGTGLFGTPNQLVFEVTVLGDVYGHSFNSTSDRNAKENFSSVSPAEILDKVASLPVTQWNFKGEQKEVQHIGPMAQDFHAAFGLDGTEDKRISLTDEGGVALAAIQGLNQKLDEKDAEINTLKQQNDLLTQRLNALESAVKQLATQK